MQAAYLRIELKVKFRAFGFTLGTVTENRTVALPGEAALVAQLIGPKTFFAYNDHGIMLNLTLQDKP